MKSLRCWDQIVDPINLWRGWREFERGKRRRPDVATFSLNAERHVLRLAAALKAGTWRHGSYRLLYLADPKRRVISASTVADRVVHHAVHRILAPWWNRRFIDHSYACLPGRGSHRALMAFQGALQRHPFGIKLDIARYFYSVDRARLREILAAALPEEPLRALLDLILGSGRGLYQRKEVVDYLGWEAPLAPGLGLPIGNLTSQWWGNVYLDGLDHHAQQHLRLAGWQRYMDDLAFFGRDPAALVEARDAIATWLATERSLRLKDPEAQPFSTRQPVLYLGYQVTREGFRLGPKARGRLREAVRTSAGDPERAAARIGAFAAAWMFGR